MLSSVLVSEAVGLPLVQTAEKVGSEQANSGLFTIPGEDSAHGDSEQTSTHPLGTASALEKNVDISTPTDEEFALLASAPGKAEKVVLDEPELSSETLINNDTETAVQSVTLEHFANALRTVGHQDGEELHFNNPATSEVPFEPRAYALVVAEVAERLASLAPDEKLVAAPITQEITDTLQAIQLLRSESAPNAEVLAAEKKLTELTTQLFEAIGVRYDEADIKQFVQQLLEPKLIEYLVSENPTAVEGIGTHEIKRYLRELISTLSSLFPQFTTHQLLGTVAIGLY